LKGLWEAIPGELIVEDASKKIPRANGMQASGVKHDTGFRRGNLRAERIPEDGWVLHASRRIQPKTGA
jgi:hypothetical protein